MRIRRRVPLALKVAVLVAVIAVGTAAIITVLGMNVALRDIDNAYETEAHDLRQVISDEIVRSGEDPTAVDRLLAQIVRSQPDLLRIRVFGGSASNPVLLASSQAGDLAPDAGTEVFAPQGEHPAQLAVRLDGKPAFLNVEPIPGPAGADSIAFYFDDAPRARTISDTRRSILASTVAVIIVELGALAVAIYVLVLRRIRLLSSAAASVARGDLSTRIGRSETNAFPDELSETIDQFDLMALAVESRTREQEAAMARQREAEERYRLVVDNAVEMISLTSPDGSILFASPAHGRLLGLRTEALIGTSLLDLVHPDDRDRVRATLDQAKTGLSITLPELRLIHRNGSIVWVDLTSAPARDEADSLYLLHVAHDVTERRRAQEERRRLLAELMAAQEEERQRIAEDLHDDPIQTMTAASMRLEAVRNLATDSRQAQLIERLEASVSNSIQRLRSLMFELRPPALDRDGLAAALADYLGAVRNEHGISTELQAKASAELDPDGRVLAFRIAKEAVMNAVKHSGASAIRVGMDGGPEGVRISVRDDGSGFDSSAAEARHDHIGLDSMRERARLAGGWLRIDTAPGRGTTVEFFVPSGEPGGPDWHGEAI